ncbi:MAG TPA: hypothetical protein VFQ61_23915 [Polyangiaceae bacterium]|nr:hypothetical protein [Polyangiaceae bacterium]
MRSAKLKLVLVFAGMALTQAELCEKAYAQMASSLSPSGAEVNLAETLYRQGRELMAAGKYADAAAKFAESYRLDPATGTLLNLATCQEQQGKLASAWLTFSEAARAARREQRDDRVRFAEQHVSALEPRLPRLTIQVSVPSADLQVRLNGIAIGPAAYGVPTPIDPGVHRIEATGPDYKPWRQDVRIEHEAESKTVVVPVLEAAPEAQPKPAARMNDANRAQPSALPPAVPTSPVVQRPVPVAAYVSGAVCVLTTTGALVTGALYLNQKDEYEKQLSDGDSRSKAHALGVANLALWGAAGVSAALTAYLYFARPERTQATAVSRGQNAGVRWVPWAATQEQRLVAAGLNLGSEF